MHHSTEKDNTYHGLCHTSRRALAGRRNNSMLFKTTRQYNIKFFDKSYIFLVIKATVTDKYVCLGWKEK